MTTKNKIDLESMKKEALTCNYSPCECEFTHEMIELLEEAKRMIIKVNGCCDCTRGDGEEWLEHFTDNK